MASKEFPLSIVLRTIDQASPGMQKLQRQLEPIVRKMEKISASAIKVGKNLTTNLTLPILALGGAATKVMADFEQGMSDISTLVDTNVVSMGEMEAAILAIGKRTPVEIGKLQGALYNIVSAGIPAADAMAVLEKSAQLGVAGLGSTEEAADAVTSAINAFGLEGKEAAAVYDVLFKTIKNGKTTLPEFTQGFGAVAGIVAATGTEFDEYAASVAALTTVGNPASQVHTQLKAVMSGLTRDTKETRKVFRALGSKDLKDLIEKSGGFVEALEAISGELGGNEAKILKLVGSNEAMGAILGLTGKQAEKFKKALENMRNGVEEVTGAFEKQNSTTKSSIQRTKNAMSSMAISIGKIIAPALEKLTEKIQGAVEWYESLTDGSKELIVTITGIAATLGPTIYAFGQLAKVMNLLKAHPVIAAASGIAWAALEIYKNWDDFEAFFKLLWDGVKGVFQDAWDFIEPIVNAVKEAVDTVKDAKAYLSGDETSADKSRQNAKNAKIMLEFEGRTGVLRGEAAADAVDEKIDRFDALANSMDPLPSMGPAALPAGRKHPLDFADGNPGLKVPNGTVVVEIVDGRKPRAHIKGGGTNLEVNTANTGDQMSID